MYVRNLRKIGGGLLETNSEIKNRELTFERSGERHRHERERKREANDRHDLSWVIRLNRGAELRVSTTRY